MSCMTMFYHMQCSYMWELKVTIVPTMTFLAFAYAFLQMGIVLKVEALVASSVWLLRGLLLALAMFGLAFVVLHIGVVLDTFPLSLFYVESVLMLCMAIIFAAFTWFAAREMLRCRDALCRAKIDKEMQDRHRLTLAVHTVAIATANGTLLLAIVATGLALTNKFQGHLGWFFAISMSVDNMMNTMCMVLLSGLSVSVCKYDVGRDVIAEIKAAGTEARCTAAPHASAIGNAVEIEVAVSECVR